MAPNPGEAAGEDGCSPPRAADHLTRHNLRVESLFSLFNGVFMGMILFAAPVLAVTCLGASRTELTVITCAFPCGAFLGPVWAMLGRRWGMQKLVLQMALWANLPLFLMVWVDESVAFTAIITASQLLHSAMRMGMSSMYRATYPRPLLGRVLGWLTFCTFLTMVPTVLLAGWLSDASNDPTAYHYLFPAAGAFGLLACLFYARVRPAAGAPVTQRLATLRSGIRHVRRVVVSNRAYMFFQLAFFLSGAAFFMSTHITLLLTHDDLGFDAFQLALWLSVLPQVVLAVSSPGWGVVLDRIGIVRARLLISAVMTFYLACYFGGIALGVPGLMYIGSVLRGLSEGGGQVTWAMASVHFAPKPEDVPLYNGIHFVLNGIRGLVMPWVGAELLFPYAREWTVFIATLVSAASIFVIGYSLRYGHGPEPTPVVLQEDGDDLPGPTGQPTAEAG